MAGGSEEAVLRDCAADDKIGDEHQRADTDQSAECPRNLFIWLPGRQLIEQVIDKYQRDKGCAGGQVEIIGAPEHRAVEEQNRDDAETLIRNLKFLRQERCKAGECRETCEQENNRADQDSASADVRGKITPVFDRVEIMSGFEIQNPASGEQEVQREQSRQQHLRQLITHQEPLRVRQERPD